MDIAIKKRILFYNLVFYTSEKEVLLLNLVSFRRMRISVDELNSLRKTQNRVERGESITERQDLVYFQLLSCKQILTDAMVEYVDSNYLSRSNNHFGPIKNVTFNLSYKCNLNCGYCYQKHYKSNDGRIEDSDIPLIKQFIEEYNQNNKELNLVTISGGESLLDENVVLINNIINTIRSKEYILFTNGINIIQMSERIDFSKFNVVQVSLDGNDEVICKINNSNIHVYRKIVQGIKYLAGLGCSIRIVCMISKEISLWLDYFLKQLENEDIFRNGKVRLRISIPMDDHSTDIVAADFFNYDEYLVIKEIISRSNMKEYITLDSLPGFTKLKHILKRKVNEEHNGVIRPCRQDEFTVLFGPKGNVYWCMCKDVDRAIIGNYRTKVINYDLLNAYKSRTIFTIDKCSKCEMRYVCASGCPLNIEDKENSVFVPVCREFANELLVEKMEGFVL